MNSVQKKLIIGIVIILAATVWMVYGGIESAGSYYMTTDEMLAMNEKAFTHRLRVAGFVQEDSLKREGGRVQFALAVEGDSVPVVYLGRKPVPDTLREGGEAVVEGRYTRERVFEADHIQAKCASKYEAELKSEKPQSGEPPIPQLPATES